MNDFQGLLSSDFGFKPQGKAAPMAPPRSNHNTSNVANSSAFDFDIGSGKTSSYSKSSSGTLIDDHGALFRPSNSTGSNRKPNDFGNLGGYDDVFGGISESTANSSVNLDSIFSGSGESESKFSSLPVFDKPVYDDDVFDGVSGLKSSSSAKYEDIFSSSSSSPWASSAKKHDAFDELLGGLGRKESEPKRSGGSGSLKGEKVTTGFDDLLPGFGPSGDRSTSDISWAPKSPASGTTQASTGVDDPLVVLNSSSPSAPFSSGVSSDPLEQFSKLNNSSGKKDESFSSTRGVFDDLDPLGSLGKSAPMDNREKSGSPVRTGLKGTGRQSSASAEESDKSFSVKSPGRISEKRMPAEDYRESPGNIFDMPSAPVDSHRSFPDSSSPSHTNTSSEPTFHKHTSSGYEENLGSSDDVWLTVFEVPLFTQPTAAPRPSRPPPPRPPRSKVRAGSFAPLYAKKKADEFPSFPSSAQYPQSMPMGGKSYFASPIDELEDFAKGSSWNNVDGSGVGEDLETNSVAAASAAAMKEAMDRAEAKFRHAKGVRERENAKRMQQEREDRTTQDYVEREYRERQEKLEHERQQREEEERKQREEEERMRREREREEREKELRRIERERARLAVERATREARERAAAEARIRAEKAAVGKAQAEARERAERAAVLRAQAEARERAARAAAEAKQKADREKAEREPREKAEREAKEKEARDRAARMSQQRNENDLDSFFGVGSRASSAPRPRASSSDPAFDSQFQSMQSESVRSSAGSASSMRKASSSTSIVDDLSSIFGAAPSSGMFQEVEGESEERRRARLERHQRTQERAAKALAEKNQRDLEAQREQAERHRIAETLDVEIKRWAAGKEGNLRALLSTLQYVLWPECGWLPVSLTDLITAASVKKVYRKATLCIHPDKVQQKGATLQQKYIAEKVFDLLKEAWNKFNSEELF